MMEKITNHQALETLLRLRSCFNHNNFDPTFYESQAVGHAIADILKSISAGFDALRSE